MGAAKIESILSGQQTCTRCGVLKPLDQFSFHRLARNGRQSRCRLCDNEVRRKPPKAPRDHNAPKVCKECKQEKSADQFRIIRKDNIYRKGVCNKCFNDRSQALRHERTAIGLCSRCKNPAAEGKTLCERHAKKWKESWDRRTENIKIYRKLRYPDIKGVYKTAHYKTVRNAHRQKQRDEKSPAALLENMRRRINKSVRDHSSGLARKGGRTTELIGCSVVDLMTHLEKQFVRGMSWENYGYRGWHIDHIRPCAKFDLTDLEQQKACFHFTNLRPLWAEKNWEKRAKLELLL